MPAHRVEASRFVRVDPALAFDRLLATPLPEVFAKRYAAFPAIKEVVDAPDEWGTPGQTRTIRLADGGHVRETLTVVDRPRVFGYVLDEIHGALAPFVRTVDGEWTFAPEDDGTRVDWAWTLHSKRAPARLTLNVIGRMWKGYADRALTGLETILTR
jgi:hypothetical protein